MQLLPLTTLGVYDCSVACRHMIRSGIPRHVVEAHYATQRPKGGVSLDYLEVRYGKMYGPRRPKAATTA